MSPTSGLSSPCLNVKAYVLGPLALALPHWVAVATTVTAVLLLTGREQLHALARRIELKEIITAGEFLILTGMILPLLPNTPVTTLTKITPQQVWLALVVVCTFSYVSYLAQRYWAAAARGLWMAALGGLYSSTAATVVLARQAKANPALGRQARAGITLATGIMYLRIEAVVAIFNLTLARVFSAPFLCGLAVVAFVICAVQYWGPGRGAEPTEPQTAIQTSAGRNPLESRAGRNLCAIVRRRVAGLELCYDAIWHVRHLCAGSNHRRLRHRSVRAQPRSGRSREPVELGARRGDPDRRLIEQCAQGVLRGLICGRASDRGQRRGPHCACHWGRRPRYLVGAGLDIAPAAAGRFQRII